MNSKVSQFVSQKFTLNKYTGSFILLGLLVLGEIGLLAVTIFPDKKAYQSVQQSNVNQSNLPEEKARSVTVKIVSGEFLGSGIIIAKQGKTYRVLTNHHILDDSTKEYEIRTSDDTAYQGKIAASAADFAGNDLAIVDFKVQKKNYPVAKFGKTPKTGDEVFFAGFSPSEVEGKDQAWIFQKESIGKILDKPLKQGYQIGYTNENSQETKEGVLLNKNGEIIAITGMETPSQIGEMKGHYFAIPSNSIPPWVFSLPNEQNGKSGSKKAKFGSISID